MTETDPAADARGLQRRAAAFAMWWVRTYTRGLDPLLADTRRREIASDVWEQQALGREVGAPPPAVAASVLRRVIAGMPADLTWSHAARSVSRAQPNTRERRAMSTPKTMWLPALAGLLGLFQIVAGTEMLISDPKLDNAIALTVFAGLGLAALIGIGLRRGRRAVGDVLVMIGVLPSFVIYLWWLVPALLAAVVVIATAVDLADTKVIPQPASTRPAA